MTEASRLHRSTRENNRLKRQRWKSIGSVPVSTDGKTHDTLKRGQRLQVSCWCRDESRILQIIDIDVILHLGFQAYPCVWMNLINDWKFSTFQDHELDLFTVPLLGLHQKRGMRNTPNTWNITDCSVDLNREMQVRNNWKRKRFTIAWCNENLAGALAYITI